MLAIGAQIYISGLQAQSAQAAQNAQQVANQKTGELLVYARPASGLSVVNSGPGMVRLVNMYFKFPNGSVYYGSSFTPALLPSSGSALVSALVPGGTCLPTGTSACLSRFNAVTGTTTLGYSIGLLTSNGNTFWYNPASASSSSSYAVGFDAIGDSAFGSNPVLTVDGTNFLTSQLPVTFNWAGGSQHTYAFQTLSQGSGTRVGISSVTGLATSASGTMTVSGPGTAQATYTTQYLLAVSGGGGIVLAPASPGGDGYYNSGTQVQVTTNYVWNQVAGQSRQNLVSYGVDGATPTSLTRTNSGTYTIALITMNAPHTVTFNSVTQYYLTLQGSLPSSGTVTSPVTATYQYESTYTSPSNALSNPGFESGSTSGWTNYAWAGYGDPSYAAVTAPVHSGSYSASISTSSAGVWIATFGQEWSLPDNLPSSGPLPSLVTTVGTLSGSIWAQVPGSTLNLWVEVGTSNLGNNALSGCLYQSGNPGSSWTQLSGSVTTCDLSSDTHTGRLIEFLVYTSSGGPWTAYIDDGSFSFSYSNPTRTTTGVAPSYTISGSTVTYSYSLSIPFPSGSFSTSWELSIPGTESYNSNTCSASLYNGNTAVYTTSNGVSSCTMVATASLGSSSVSQSGSQTGDNWYDSGTTATITASPTGTVAFGSWSQGGALSVANPTASSTTITLTGYDTVTGNFGVTP